MRSGRFILFLCFFMFFSASFVSANYGVWTGLGTDARWSNQDNWKDGALPTSSDNVSYEKLDDWYGWLNRQTAIVIDSQASCNNWSFFHYYHHIMPFNDIQLIPGADLVVSNNEYIDQCSMYTGKYTQTGGSHTVNGDYSFASYNGQFLMSDGSFTVNGKMVLSPDNGSVKITGGTVTANSLEIGSLGWSYGISISPQAQIHITNEVMLSFAIPGCRADIDTPLYMDGADFYNNIYVAAYLNIAKDWHMIFQADTSETMELEVTSGDWGKDYLSRDYFTLDTLQIGDELPGKVMLIDAFNNFDDYYAPGIEAAYVDTLIITDGSILNLNGYNLYYNNIIIQGDYQFLNGSPTQIPEPTTILLLTTGVLMLLRKKS